MKLSFITPSAVLLAICWPAGVALHAQDGHYADDLAHVEDPGEPQLRAMQEMEEKTTYLGPGGLRDPVVRDEEVRDMRIEGHIGVAYFEDDKIDAGRVSVAVDKGVVRLSGEVASDEARSLAEQIARETTNVSSVHNELQVSAAGDAGSDS
jgi:hypothetical protein